MLLLVCRGHPTMFKGVYSWQQRESVTKRVMNITKSRTIEVLCLAIEDTKVF